MLPFDSALRASRRALDPAVTRPATSEPRSGESSGGEGRIRTFEAARATDLQSAAFDRFATSPTFCCMECAAFDTYRGRKSERWSWRRDLNPRPADYKSAALPLSYASPAQTHYDTLGCLQSQAQFLSRKQGLKPPRGYTVTTEAWACLPRKTS